MESVSSRSKSRTPYKVAVTVMGLGTTGKRDESEPGVREQVTGGTADDVALGKIADGVSGGLTTVQGI